MKKTLNVNIAGIAFILDEDAYNKLEWYLNTLSSHFENTEERQEIMGDIELRIAELLKERKKVERNVVDLDEINSIIAILGEPQEIYSEGIPKTGKNEEYTTLKRVYRDIDNRIIGGVCSGISNYFNIDPIILRVIFAIAFFVYGSGFLLYLILWIAMPAALTTAQKLEMKGEPITVSNIQKSVREEFGETKDKYQKEHYSSITNFFDRLAHFLHQVVTFLGKSFLLILGFTFLIAGLAGLVAFVSAVFFTSHVAFGHFPLSEISNTFFSSGLNYNLFITALLLVGGIPLLAIGYTGLRLLINLKSNHKLFGITALAAWLIGIMIMIPLAISESTNYKYTKTITDRIELPQVNSDTIAISLNSEIDSKDFEIVHHKKSEFFIAGKKVFIKLDVDIESSPDSKCAVIVRKKSKGSTPDNAKQNAMNLKYDIQTGNNFIILPQYFEIPDNSGFRFQEMDIIIQIPKNKIVKIDDELEEMLEDTDNDYYINLNETPEKYWRMNENKLEMIK